jgi:hypothetical protein
MMPTPISASIISSFLGLPQLPPSLHTISSFRLHWQLDSNTLIQIAGIRFKLQRSHLSKGGDATPELRDDVLYMCSDRLDISARELT